MDKKVETAGIADMYLAAAILSYGADLKGIDRSDPRKQKFEFVNTITKVYLLNDGKVEEVESPSFDLLESKFIGRSLMYLPNYADCLKRVKAALHSV